VDKTGVVSVTDPEMCRVISFSSSGQSVRVWEGCATGAFGRPSGIASDDAGGLWVTDAASGTLVHFKTEITNP
jgi:streptogramin lyase